MKEINLKFGTDLQNISDVRGIISPFIRDEFMFLLAITEALNNVLEHAETDEIEMKVHFLEFSWIEIKIIYQGERFDSSKKASFPEPEGLAEGGFGVALM